MGIWEDEGIVPYLDCDAGYDWMRLTKTAESYTKKSAFYCLKIVS